MQNNPQSYKKLKTLECILEKRIVAIQIYIQHRNKSKLDADEAKMSSSELHARCDAFQQIKMFLEQEEV